MTLGRAVHAMHLPLLEPITAYLAARAMALRVTVLQAVLLLTWTLYALFLPQMAQRCGIPAGLVIWILVADQLIFMTADWLAGVYADRLAAATRRVGPVINVAGAVAALLLALMPWVAELGVPWLWLGLVAVWAASSSFLRAPAFSLLGRLGGVSRKSGTVSWGLVGVCVASAVGPLLTTTLVQADAGLALLAAAASLFAAARFASGADVKTVGRTAPPIAAEPGDAAASLRLALCVLAGAFAMQVHTALVPGKLHGLDATLALLWGPVYWIGFAMGLMAGARLAQSVQARRGVVLLAVAGAIGLAVAPRSTEPGIFTLLQLSAGLAWAVIFTLALSRALSHGGRGGLASPVGLVFSAIAAAAVLRLLLTAFAIDWAAWATPLAAASALACIGLLIVHPWVDRASTHAVGQHVNSPSGATAPQFGRRRRGESVMQRTKHGGRRWKQSQCRDCSRPHRDAITKFDP